MGGIIGAAAVGGSLLSTTGTAGTDGSNTGYNPGGYGSLATAAFKDRAATTRTINFLIWNGSSIQFWCNAPSVPNTDQTFSSIILTGAGGVVRLARSAATYNGSQSGGLYSSWVWTDATQPASSGNAFTLGVT